MTRATIDVSHLKLYAYGSKDPLWWGIAGLIAIEATAFVLLVATYFYIRGSFEVWPPIAPSSRSMALGGGAVVALVPSALTMSRVSHWARKEALRPMRLWLLATCALAWLSMAMRASETASIGFRWDSNAYGSVFWMMLGIHTLVLLIGTGELTVLAALTVFGAVERRHAADIDVTGLYWGFVALSWPVFFAVLYLEPLFAAK